MPVYSGDLEQQRQARELEAKEKCSQGTGAYPKLTATSEEVREAVHLLADKRQTGCGNEAANLLAAQLNYANLLVNSILIEQWKQVSTLFAPERPPIIARSLPEKLRWILEQLRAERAAKTAAALPAETPTNPGT